MWLSMVPLDFPKKKIPFDFISVFLWIFVEIFGRDVLLLKRW